MNGPPKGSEVVVALADLASQGVYKEVTPQGARNMNRIFELAADLINYLEQEEKEADEEELSLEELAQLCDDEEGEANE